MNKIKLALASASAWLLPVAVFAISVNNGTGGTGGSVSVPSGVPTFTNVTDVIGKIELFMWIIFGVIAVVMFIIAGITFLTAGGDAEKIKTARTAFIWGVAGIVVAIIAYSIINIVTSAIT